MKRYLNLNDYGGKAILITLTFIGVIPALLYLANFFLQRAQMRLGVLDRSIHLSFGIGLILMIVFIVLIILEQIQDAYLDRRYQKDKHDDR